jgi:cyclic-di-AMP phosphodiesterase PgpH
VPLPVNAVPAGTAPRGVRKTSRLIRARPRGRIGHGLVLSLAFAVLGAPLVMVQSWLVADAEITSGEPAPVTVRVPLFLGRTLGDVELREGAIVVARGDLVVDRDTVTRVQARQPRGAGVWLTYGLGLLLIGLVYTAQLRRSHKGRLLRAQLVNLAVILAMGIGSTALLTTTSMSVLILPVAALALMAAIAIDLGAALATALVAALVLGALTPFDPGVITILAVQGAVAALVLGDRPRRRIGRLHLLGAGLVGGVAAALCYFLIYSLFHDRPPLAELDDPLRSAWVAAALAGPLGALLAIPALPLYQRALGDIPLGTLVELEDLSHPLLKKIADNSPGTWQHSLAMANMAEIAANAIGANGRLVRVGAYYHDLGKSLQPKYFIENLSGGESSPHDALQPAVSCDAIFSHVTEGVRVARKHGLHERIVDFMHMHHGDGLLEYFWVKCQEQGNPDGLTADDFRYPGVKPHSKETAILAICDAVEAASRTLRNPDTHSIESLVQRIVYGKLHLGQLDQSGLTVADLRKISDSLMETIKHAHHGRIEYPWQRQQRAEEESAADRAGEPTGGEVSTQRERPRPFEEMDRSSATQRLLREPRLDSLDVPRPAWRPRSNRPSGGTPLEIAATEEMNGANGEGAAAARSEPDATATVALTRPPTAAEVARATAPLERVPGEPPDQPDSSGGDPGVARRRAHTIRRAETPTEPVADVTVERALAIPPEALAEDPDADPEGPTRPRASAPGED